MLPEAKDEVCRKCQGSGIEELVEYVDDSGLNWDFASLPCSGCSGSGLKNLKKPAPKVTKAQKLAAIAKAMAGFKGGWRGD